MQWTNIALQTQSSLFRLLHTAATSTFELTFLYCIPSDSCFTITCEAFADDILQRLLDFITTSGAVLANPSFPHMVRLLLLLKGILQQPVRCVAVRSICLVIKIYVLYISQRWQSQTVCVLCYYSDRVFRTIMFKPHACLFPFILLVWYLCFLFLSQLFQS